MEYRKLEKKLITYGAPVFAGIKPSVLFREEEKSIEEWKEYQSFFHSIFKNSQLRLYFFYNRKNQLLILIYREDLIKKVLLMEHNQLLLLYYKYPAEFNLDDYFKYLANRLKTDEFPHEIGIFLGYPIEDVWGFMKYKGKNYLLNGEWKVYEKETEKKAVFYKYQKCRVLMSAFFSDGILLEEACKKIRLVNL